MPAEPNLQEEPYGRADRGTPWPEFIFTVDKSVALMSDFFVPDEDVPPPGVTVQALPSVAAAKP